MAAHILSALRHAADLRRAGQAGGSDNIGIGPDNLFMHMTGMSDFAWQKVQGRRRGGVAGGADRDEHAPRHAADPEDAELGIEPSLSTDVECTLTADFFTQMRTTMALQRMFVNEPNKLASRPSHADPTGTPPLLNTRDVLRSPR